MGTVGSAKRSYWGYQVTNPSVERALNSPVSELAMSKPHVKCMEISLHFTNRILISSSGEMLFLDLVSRSRGHRAKWLYDVYSNQITLQWLK